MAGVEEQALEFCIAWSKSNHGSVARSHLEQLRKGAQPSPHALPRRRDDVTVSDVVQTTLSRPRQMLLIYSVFFKMVQLERNEIG